MKIVACVKRVPTTDTQARIAPDGKSLDVSAFQYMLSFYDEIAVEQAIRTKEQHGGEVTLLSIGPADTQKELRECLAKGADDAVLLVDPQWMSRDALSTAKVLAEKVRELGAQLVFTGRVATDRDNAAVGAMLATLLGWSCVTDVVQVSVEGERATAKRESEAGIESYSFSLPAVITCQKGLAEPRYAALKGIMAAKKKPLNEAQPADVPSQAQVRSLELPAPRKEGRIVGEGTAGVAALITALREEAKLL